MRATQHRQTNGFRLFLQVGDSVTHRDYGEWGEGKVVEEMTSTIPGGTCLVRILFRDGRQRTFNNDLDSQMCCYYMGMRKLWDPEEEKPPVAPPRQRRLSRRH